ncbi:copper homeostasis membrane protein CopD [Sphingopyxis sp.]|jgi:putative copper resistance protein D|uniref:copper homeostasis membrane protein CopD n=1 Tax=Sphingopyxis sp. TaxID=1908224 RepID=UPI0035B41B6F
MVDLLLMGVRFALFAVLTLIAGLAAFPLHALEPGDRRNSGPGSIVARPLPWLCAAALLLSLLGIAVLTASMQGVGLVATDLAMVVALVRETDVGTAWLVRMAALLVATAGAFRIARNPDMAAMIVAAAGAVALTTLTWSSHAGASEGTAGWIHRASDALHMQAAAVWLGAIAGFLLLLRPSEPVARDHLALTARSLDRFARVGTICVFVIAATGLVNGQMIVGAANIVQAMASPYGQLLALKLILFAAMLGLAAANRWRLTPALGRALDEPDIDPAGAARAMRLSLMLEALAGLAILALVAWFGMLEPFDPA